MDKFYLEKVTYKRKEDIIEYIRELYKLGSRINGVGRLQDYVTEVLRILMLGLKK